LRRGFRHGIRAARKIQAALTVCSARATCAATATRTNINKKTLHPSGDFPIALTWEIVKKPLIFALVGVAALITETGEFYLLNNFVAGKETAVLSISKKRST